jgi:ABC-type dipeptide/oligopeptide/nickel transport system ATPase subunit
MKEIIESIRLLNIHQKEQYREIPFQRDVYSEINWSFRCIGIVGERGVGKTTLIFQHLIQMQI